MKIENRVLILVGTLKVGLGSKSDIVVIIGAGKRPLDEAWRPDAACSNRNVCTLV